ncbi:MAG: GNAT family N-acetyltransferase [Halopseudomonas aestusnigri]
MTAIKIYKAKSSDAEDISDCVIALLKELSMGLTIPEPNKVREKCINMLGQDKAFHAFLAKNKVGEIIGLLTLHETDALFASSPFAEIMEFYVVPNYRSKGIGQKFIRKIEEYAKEMNWSSLTLNAPPLNISPATVRFYEREGFIHKGPYMGKKL